MPAPTPETLATTLAAPLRPPPDVAARPSPPAADAGGTLLQTAPSTSALAHSENQATDALNAVVELLRWQSTRRLSPWLFFVTTFASPEEINRPACMPLVQAIKDNADECSDFRKELEQKAGLDADGILECFQVDAEDLPEASRFIRIFTLAMAK